jgi:hypothetical protein
VTDTVSTEFVHNCYAGDEQFEPGGREVCDHPPADGQLDRRRRAIGTVVNNRHDDGLAPGVVDDGLDMVVATDTSITAGRVLSEDPMTTAIRHASKLLVSWWMSAPGVEGDVADGSGRHPVGVLQPADATLGEDSVDTRGRASEKWPEPIRPVPPGRPGDEDLRFDRWRQAAW